MWEGYHFTSQLLLFGGSTTIPQPGFINPGLALVLIVQAGVNLNAPLDSNHMTALMIACMMGNWDRPAMVVDGSV